MTTTEAQRKAQIVATPGVALDPAHHGRVIELGHGLTKRLGLCSKADLVEAVLHHARLATAHDWDAAMAQTPWEADHCRRRAEHCRAMAAGLAALFDSTR